LGLGFLVDVVTVGVCFAFCGFFYNVIAQTMSQYCGSKFVWIWGCNMNLWSCWSTS